ncbi:DUF6070 family protein [Lacrimispora sp. BS-2]|uniref:DUF6070 family protein n=1 Tax=Lacrimispora sp. BS-2 TaxID=3151850 RepID=A0AAU7PMP7_9FIRM
MNRRKLIAGIAAIIFVLTGCRGASKDPLTGKEAIESEGNQQNQGEDVSIELAELCKDIYQQSKKNKTLGSLETVQKMVNRLGERGYAVVDQDNQLNMENQELVEAFCKNVAEKQDAELLLIIVLNNGEFVQFNFNTKEGKVDVSAKSLFWQENELVNLYTDNYQPNTWVFSEYGYLFFDKYYMAGFSGPYDHVAVRVKPLDNIYRELNRKYILPIGYHLNNLFTIDWNENEYKNLNFYDLFDILYQLKFSTYNPYSSDYDGKISQIPKTEFEGIIMENFKIRSQILQEKVKYMDSNSMYEYRPRGLYDCGSDTEIPYPEVIDYENQDDGTIELTVNAVWPKMNLETAFQHKVVIRPLPDGKFQYVSNQVIPSENNVEPTWYVNRLTEEEWKEYYKTIK